MTESESKQLMRNEEPTYSDENCLVWDLGVEGTFDKFQDVFLETAKEMGREYFSALLAEEKTDEYTAYNPPFEIKKRRVIIAKRAPEDMKEFYSDEWTKVNMVEVPKLEGMNLSSHILFINNALKNDDCPTLDVQQDWIPGNPS